MAKRGTFCTYTSRRSDPALREDDPTVFPFVHFRTEVAESTAAFAAP